MHSIQSTRSIGSAGGISSGIFFSESSPYVRSGAGYVSYCDFLVSYDQMSEKLPLAIR